MNPIAPSTLCRRALNPCIASIAAVFATISPTSASVVFNGSGLNPEVNASASGSAMFQVSGGTLTILLTNTTDPRTTAQGNALTGVVFDVLGGAPALVLSGISLAPNSALWTSKTTSTTSTNLAGSWTGSLGSLPLAGYGAATTGFNGAFQGGSIALGNSSPNYGIVADGTFNGTNVSFGGSQFPFIQNGLLLTFSGADGLSESQFGNVRLLFGTDGSGVVGTQQVPAPGALALLALSGAVAMRRRRH